MKWFNRLDTDWQYFVLFVLAIAVIYVIYLANRLLTIVQNGFTSFGDLWDQVVNGGATASPQAQQSESTAGVGLLPVDPGSIGQ